MLRFWVRRVVRAAATLAFVGTVGFVTAWHMPVIAESPGGAIAAANRYDGPVLAGFLGYVSTLAAGDLGYSVVAGEPVTSVLAHAIPWTVLVVSTGTVLIFGLGILVGSLQAYLEGTPVDYGTTAVTVVCLSVPFWIVGILLVWFLSYVYPLFPPFGVSTVPPGEGLTPAFLASVAHHAVLPVAAYASTEWAQEALIMRGNSVRVLGAKYVRSARLRGIGTGRIARQYVARNALLPMYTAAVVSLSFRFGYVVILEDIFRYEGLGWYLLRAASGRDVPLLVGTFFAFAAMLVVAITAVDLTYRFVDPRVESDESRTAY